LEPAVHVAVAADVQLHPLDMAHVLDSVCICRVHGTSLHSCFAAAFVLPRMARRLLATIAVAVAAPLAAHHPAMVVSL
jgi:hypothetical protein